MTSREESRALYEHVNLKIYPTGLGAFHLGHTHLGGGGSGLLYIPIAYYMQKGGRGFQKACKIVYVINGRPFMWIGPFSL